ncbi:MAG: 4-hydroxythreonine-4-phosphate dehydrogenase PdxA [Bacteroidetes bacterium]|nr:MAG: 4-hydroxythreonine-4-phosphate dehydrogenase PdxA [Bacteroidota bacterium]
MQEKLKIGISQGDINGISYEVIIKTLMDQRIQEICTPVIFGSPKVLAYHRKTLDLEGFSPTSILSAAEARSNKCYVINCIDEHIRVELGKATRTGGQASFQALQAATDALEKGHIDALVTGPINKHNIQQAAFNYSGHTEYLQARFRASEVMMLMVSELLKVGLVAAHVPISRLSSFITTGLIEEKIEILSASLTRDFSIRNPRIAVLGLNPHAGDQGLLGSEEEEIIVPAIAKSRSKNINVFGPYPADGFFGAGKFSKFDAVLAMYHDQGLAPFKALSMDNGVNYTAGLPVVRTSPAHGTAFELAGKNEAEEASFRNALYLAIDIVKNRRRHEEMTANPLKTGKGKRQVKDESPEDLGSAS